MTRENIFKFVITIAALIFIIYEMTQGLVWDENGLLVIYRFIYRGERMFVDSWGEYHMAGVLMIPVFALYYQVLEPIFNQMGIGLVLYTRIIYLIVRLAVSIYLFFTIKRTKFENGAFLSALFYFVFIVGWRNFSYKSICDLGLILLCCFIVRYCVTRRGYYFVLMGIATCISILAYPTMIVMPFAIVIGGLILSHNGYALLKHIIVYSITCFVCGGLFLAYLQATSGIIRAFEYIGKYTNDSYDDSFLVRIGKMVLSYVIVGVIAYFPIFLMWLYKRFRELSLEVEEMLLGIYWIAIMAVVIALRIESVSYSRYIYGILVLFMWVPYISKEKKRQYTIVGSYKDTDDLLNKSFKIIFVISCVSQGIWAVSTNQDISIPGYMAYYTVICFIAFAISEERYRLMVFGVVAACLYFGCIWLSDANGGYHDIFQDRYLVTEGALEGIYLSKDDYEKNQQVMELMNDYVTDEDNLLVTFAYNSTAYLNTDARIAAGSPYFRPQIDTMLLRFWESCPEHIANLVLIDRGIDKYQELLESECGQYLLAEYTEIVAENGDFILLSK